MGPKIRLLPEPSEFASPPPQQGKMVRDLNFLPHICVFPCTSDDYSHRPSERPRQWSEQTSLLALTFRKVSLMRSLDRTGWTTSLALTFRKVLLMCSLDRTTL